VKVPWTLFLAWKQLFPTQRKVSFFSLLAVVGVALGVNVMIVVVAFMKGFQQKFREDIIDAQGHARVIPLSRTKAWPALQKELLSDPKVLAISPYLQGPLLVQKGENHSVPLSIGIDFSSGPSVLPLDNFLDNGKLTMEAHGAVDVTPVPKSKNLDDDVVFISQYVANRLGVRPAAILHIGNSGELNEKAFGLEVIELAPNVPSAEWKLSYLGKDKWVLKSYGLGFETNMIENDGRLDAGPGTPVFKILPNFIPPQVGSEYTYQTFRSSTIEVFSPAIIEKSQNNELLPPRRLGLEESLRFPGKVSMQKQ